VTLESKTEQARTIINQFNETAENKVDFDKFLKELKAAGGTTDETLSECSWEDLKSMGLPSLVAKQIAKVFRQSDKSEPRVITTGRASAMTPKELMEHYTPSDPDSAVAQRLKSMSNGKRFIIFNDDKSVNTVVSVQLLQEIKDGYPERETYFLEGIPREVYAIGDRPDNLADINPLYPKRILRPDGTCDQTNRSWSDVPDQIRCIVLLGVTQTKEINVTYETAQNIMDIVVSEDAEKRITQRYAKAFVLYERLKKENNLPSLKTSLVKNIRLDKPNDPFYGERVHKEY
jgi:hypothetical protein